MSTATKIWWIAMGIWPSRHKTIVPREHDITRDKPGRVDNYLLGAVDFSILGSIFSVPLLLAGRHPLGQLLLLVLTVGGSLAWTIRRSLTPQATWRISMAEPLLLAAVVLLVIQLIPLPDSLLEWLRGDAARTLHLWTSQDVPGRMGTWPIISLAPQETRASLVMLLAYSMFFILIVQRIQSLTDVERLLRLIALAATGMAAFGLVQLLFGNGRYFWFLQQAAGSIESAACGSFLNRNHFAHFLALGMGPVVWWALDANRNSLAKTSAKYPALRWSALAIVSLAVLLSLSRGGAAVSVLALAVIVFVGYRIGILRARSLAAMGGVLFLVVVALAMFGHQHVAERMDDWLGGSVESLDRGAQRRTVWMATTTAATQNKLVGTGAGSHRHVCPLYLDTATNDGNIENAGRFFSAHADNGPLEVFEETGIVGIVLLTAVIVLAGVWCLGGIYRSASRRLSLALGAVSASLAASTAHNLVDCPWYVPGCTVIVVVLLAVACRLFQLSGDDTRRRAQRRALPRTFARAATLVLLLVGGWMLAGRIGPVTAESYWNDYRLLCSTSISRDAAGILPSEVYESSATDSNCGIKRSIEKMIDTLESVVQRDPNHTDAHVQLAGAYLLLFEHEQAISSLNQMPLTAVREAVSASGFKSRRELEDWLSLAIGEHWRVLEKARRHARAAATQSPLQGAAYIYLAQLCFLEGGDITARVQAYMKQALAARPFDGAILLAAANEAVLAGDFDRALELWKRSYRSGRIHQRELVRRLVGQIRPQDPAGEVDFFLDNFLPDLPILRQLEKTYEAIAEDGADVPMRLRQAYADAVEAEAEQVALGQKAAELWLEARLVYVKLGDQRRAVACLQRALQCNPSSYKAHYRLALAMMEMQDLAEARRHLEWCLARKPGDHSAQQKMEEVLRSCTTRETTCATAKMPDCQCDSRELIR
ncbi:MAG: O-antigen ligase family protein [Pirellulales bacterium]|nr:O-antigen ligase family protein [Pirellulales bacterium]